MWLFQEETVVHLVIIGAGVIGTTTAWMLCARGHTVTLIDRASAVASGTTARNGAQLSYAYVAPFAAPGLLMKLPAMLTERDGPTRFRPSLDPHLWRWLSSFLLQCTTSAEAETIAAQLALSSLSQSEMQDLCTAVPLRFGHGRKGKLVIYRKAASFAGGQRTVGLIQSRGIEQHVLDAGECRALEPALDHCVSALVGGIYTPSEEVGDAAAFTQGLAHALIERASATIMLECDVEGFLMDGSRIGGVRTTQGDIRGDQVILCAGQQSRGLAGTLGLRLPLYPLKGYSATARLRAGHLMRSITDFDRKTVFAPLDNEGEGQIRIAGMADLVGEDPAIDPSRLGALRRNAATVFDIAFGKDDAAWAGLRPSTPDSRPIIGPSGRPGLFLNTGHGGLGWTLACGSARLTADMIEGIDHPIDASPFSVERF